MTAAIVTINSGAAGGHQAGVGGDHGQPGQHSPVQVFNQSSSSLTDQNNPQTQVNSLIHT